MTNNLIEEKRQVDLSQYDNSSYSTGAGWFKRVLWYYTNVILFKNGWFPMSSIKVSLLRRFGAKVGRGSLIKPCVNIKYPWLLKMGENCWIGEGVWIDNLTDISVGNNVCLSQGAMLLTGNHNYKKTTFDLMVNKIILEDGVWIGAKAVVCPGVICRTNSVLAVNSVANKNLEPNSIYQGNPAVKVKTREISR